MQSEGPNDSERELLALYKMQRMKEKERQGEEVRICSNDREYEMKRREKGRCRREQVKEKEESRGEVERLKG